MCLFVFCGRNGRKGAKTRRGTKDEPRLKGNTGAQRLISSIGELSLMLLVARLGEVGIDFLSQLAVLIGNHIARVMRVQPDLHCIPYIGPPRVVVHFLCFQCDAGDIVTDKDRKLSKKIDGLLSK